MRWPMSGLWFLTRGPRVQFLELWNGPRFNQAFQNKAGSEQRFQHSAERPAIVWYSNTDAVGWPIEFVVYQLDFKVIAGGMVIIEFVEWMMRRKHKMALSTKQTKEFAEKCVPISNVVQ